MKPFADLHIHLEQYDRETIVSMLDTIADCGVTHAALQALCKYSILENLAVLYTKLRYDRMQIYAFGSLHQFDRFGDIPYEKQAENLLALGMDGMKFLDMKPDFRKQLGKGLNHPSYDRMFSLLEERQVPVLIHSGDPETFWDPDKVTEYQKEAGWFYGDSSFLSSEEIYAEVFAMLDKHPRLQVTLAHFFFLSEKPEEAVRVMETYPNVRFDLTPGGEMYLGFSKNIDFWHDFFVKYRDRILFGTDANTYKGNRNAILNTFIRSVLTHDKTEFTADCYGPMTIRGLALDEETTDRILYRNFAAFAGERKPADPAGVRRAAEAMLDAVKNDPAMAQETAWLADRLAEN
jgi:predicted TIM-barrel fold metal-dependent hydrolase